MAMMRYMAGTSFIAFLEFIFSLIFLQFGYFVLQV